MGFKELIFMPEFSLESLQLSEEIQNFLLELVGRLALFFFCAILAPLLGRMLPFLFWWMLRFTQKFVPLDVTNVYSEFIKPVRNSLVTVGTFVFIALSLNVVAKYQILYQFLSFFIYLALAVSIAWFTSRIAQRLIRVYVVNLVQGSGGEINEVILVFETLTNVIIIMFAVVIFAQGLQLNLVAISASVGIGGVAVAFAARQALERLVGTLELFLDRPYQPGEYIQVNFNPYGEDVYGRVESIGLRSTKIRTAARNTLIIVPNSIMAGKHIENISRGKKVVAMIYLDFTKLLNKSEQALVRRVVVESTNHFWGIEKANTRISFSQPKEKEVSQARINFFITSSGEDSLRLRKRLIDLANQEISRQLLDYGIEFFMPEPVVYIDSPMTL